MLYLLLFSLVIFFDQLSKYCIVSAADNLPYSLNQFIGFSLAINRGLMSGVFHSSHMWVFIILTGIISIFVVGFGLYTLDRMLRGFMVIPEILVLSGAVSNIIDRITCGGVIDFIELRYQNFVWPIFNIADACIVIGVILMVWSSLRERECSF